VYVPSTFTDLIGNANFTVDFTTGKISGALSGIVTNDDTIVSSSWNDVSITANIAAGTNRLSGTTASTASPNSIFALKGSAAGVINGAFYGPAGQNLGAVWTLSDGTGSAIGFVGAGRQ